MALDGLISAFETARDDMIPDVIDPRNSRASLEMAEGKTVDRAYKRNRVVPV